MRDSGEPVSHNPTSMLTRHRPLALAEGLTAAVAVLAVLTCCSFTPSQQSSASTSTGPTEPTAPTTNPGDTTRCIDPDKAAVHDRILMQIESLRAGAYEQAREHASTSFKSSVNVAGFREMIESGFPFLLENQPVAFGRCRITDGTATVEVRFGEEPAITLIYFLIQSKNRWWIDGASPAVDGLADKVESS